jgi:hypothetical protein
MTRCGERSGLENKHSVFLEYPQVLYSKKTHNPRLFAKCDTSRRRKDGKLHGKYLFPFSFLFSTMFSTGHGKNRNSTVTWDLPPSFSEPSSGVTIKYELEFTVERGKLKTNKRYESDVLYSNCVDEVRQKA